MQKILFSSNPFTICPYVVGRWTSIFTGKDLSSIRKRTTSVRKNCRNIGRVEKENQIQLRWNENFIRKFVKSLSLINSEQAGRQEIEIFVVSESSVKQFFYRTQFHLYAEEGIAEINPILFRSLEELPDECLCAKKEWFCAMLLAIKMD